MFKLFFALSVPVVFMVSNSNAASIQYDLKGKISVIRDGKSSSMDIEYNTRHPNKSACEENKRQIIQTPIEVYDAYDFYKSKHHGIFGEELQASLEAQGIELFKETYIGSYEKSSKIVHLGCYPVNVAM